MRWATCLISALVTSVVPLVAATRLIESNALNVCQNSPNFTATHFSVRFTPNNHSLALSFDGVAAISGYVTAELKINVYGYQLTSETLDPCKMNLQGLCPMSAGAINVQNANIDIPQDVVGKIPGVAYTVPDLDASIRVYINSTDTGTSITCLEAALSNGKTVNQKGVGWTTAVISGIGLTASAVTAGLGNSNTAAHVAANVLAYFGFMQSQAMFGMASVHMPPIVESWTQNLQWSMGVIHVDFLDTICTWYQRSTGGIPSSVLSELSTTSVEVLKRKKRSFERAANLVFKRAYTQSETATSSTTVVRGIKRVGFRAGIEETNIFLTGFIFFVVFVAAVMILVAFLRAICHILAKKGKLTSDKFADFRVAKGILYRLILIGFPQMCVLCLWEFTQNDSAAEVVLAVVMFLSVIGTLGWAAFRVITLARRSVTLHKNPAYILYSDEMCLNKLGFLYVQYRATAYYFLVPALLYTLIKAMFISLSQPSPIVQTVAMVIIETSALIGTSIMRPWMDKKTNGYNIAIGAVNFLNAIFLLFFSKIFDQPGIVTGVMGVVFFVYNAAFTLILLILVLLTSAYAIFSKNPDLRYQPMRDDRGSFVKSQSQLITELDALGSTARGENSKDAWNKVSLLTEDNGSVSSGNGVNGSHPNLGGTQHDLPNPQFSESPANQAAQYPDARAISPGERTASPAPGELQRTLLSDSDIAARNEKYAVP
ncbi:TRP-domain-containing protein [Aspergillus heteromorphus CBS 117.55]|uniref:TRP-domain-containing protein n=1 Tax=Aspergillus heteromorphus CBS 117.55 TaxID=1448321 RepID=A0A317WKN4_9EURO|nr:TRP-domain-containing protein [Aspergillus heteromorphus CBS 117.55]PWY86943.1 TRP-domain-containing protein [Aspergillus heteromorphus CBS 117.55]